MIIEGACIVERIMRSSSICDHRWRYIVNQVEFHLKKCTRCGQTVSED
jgi:hypothetical protein